MIRVSAQLHRAGFVLDASFQTTSRVTGVFGPSGAGKTTLMNVIAGLVRPDAGSVVVAGDTVFDSAQRIDVPAHRRRIGVVFQEHRLFPHMTVRANLLYGCRRAGPEFEHAVELLELGPLLTRRPAVLSGGERQRVALGRALLARPRALLLDEPLTSLDARLKHQIIPFLRRIIGASESPVLYISHDLTEILQLTDQLLVLDAGRVVGHGTISDVIHDRGARDVVRASGWSNVLTTRIGSHRRDDGVTTLELAPESTLLAPLCPQEIGTQVRVAIAPHDIALATTPLRGISIQNQMHAQVKRCTTDGQSVFVELDIGARLIAEVSRLAAKDLDIAPGRSLICLIKVQAVRLLSGT